ncbi:MAG: hypothetical protein H0V70_28305 [Ktedonobacteraceae bacterium]|nr:hypothetical protein [Ktedonobacteraceae bacterium]
MRKTLLCKFETHADIHAILLTTGDDEIIENAPPSNTLHCGKLNRNVWQRSFAVHGTQQGSIHDKQCGIGRSETGTQRESVEHQTVRRERISAHRSIPCGFMLNWLFATMFHALRTHCANPQPRMRARSIPNSSLN